MFIVLVPIYKDDEVGCRLELFRCAFQARVMYGSPGNRIYRRIFFVSNNKTVLFDT